MSTTLVDTWMTDISMYGPIYPFVGTEVPLWILGMLFWVYFHFRQIRSESEIYHEDMQMLDTPEKVSKAMERHSITG